MKCSICGRPISNSPKDHRRLKALLKKNPGTILECTICAKEAGRKPFPYQDRKMRTPVTKDIN